MVASAPGRHSYTRRSQTAASGLLAEIVGTNCVVSRRPHDNVDSLHRWGGPLVGGECGFPRAGAMEVALFWIIFAAAAGFIASQRGRSGVGWFLLSIVISPLIAVIIVALIPSHPVAAASGS